MSLWRVFPWDPEAGDGEPFSPSFLPPPSGHGRFDLPGTEVRVLYLAESPQHAVAEVIQAFRGGVLGVRDLERAGLPLALSRVRAGGDTHERLADLCDPELLARHGLPPDRLASRHRSRTQPVARMLRDLGFAGIRWWSVFWGDWRVTALFVEDPAPELHFGPPEPLGPEFPALREAALLLGMEVR